MTFPNKMAKVVQNQIIISLISILIINTRKSNAIIGGDTAEMRNWTFMVLILYDKNMICGGTLVRPNWVLTAARCVDRSFVGDVNLIGVRVGVDDIHSAHGRIIKHTNVAVHPDFMVDTETGIVHNDLALMHLSQKLILTSGIQTIHLTKMKARLGAPCTTAGWGVDKIEVSITRIFILKLKIHKFVCYLQLYSKRILLWK